MPRILLLACIAVALAAADGPLKVVCFGDSITGDRPRKPYLHQYLKWCDLVGLGLRARGAEVIMVNSGFGGDSSHGSPSGDPPGALNRLKADVLDEHPAICVVLIGGNDFAKVKGEAPDSPKVAEVTATLRVNLTSMVQQMKQAGIKVLLLQYHAARATDAAKAWKHLDWGNPVIAEVGRAAGVPVLALEPAFQAGLASGATAEQLLNRVDGVHLNPRGELVVAEAVIARIVELGWAGKP